MKHWQSGLMALLTMTTSVAAPHTVRLASGQTVVVASGQGEPQSIGSYSIRLYAPASTPAFALDDFLSGLIRPRDGTLSRVSVMRLDPHNAPMVVVTMQSAGSGGYLAADAYSVGETHLTLRTCVRGLRPRRNLGTALRQALYAPAACGQ
ncbi:hypothetical protein THUN1379_22160 [Paludibacterium sp. THUN1379]|uniref:PliI family lysozyme inhibitor of I-type lysozyme n=1 Tax=Paludibacterium sp. THUN1379 TaxID=3112107 RepID=UPI0030871A99|nr:hypothetical protein THUN1379_22160 [Paludibacterium sp. THUN1379]